MGATALRALYGFAPHFLDLGGIRYHYVDEGEGEPIVMLHGNPTWSFYYRHLISGLREHYRVIAPDHIGCGLSDKPQDYTYTLDRHISNLEVLLQDLRLDQLTLVVHDWGGPIGMGYAVRHPEQVRRFVIFNTAAFWSPHTPWFLRLGRLPLLGAMTVRNLNVFARLATIVGCRHQERMTNDVRAGYLFPYDSSANRVALLRFIQDIPSDPAHPTYALLRSIESGLAQFRRHPMLVVWGDQDPVFTHAFLEEWRARFPGARVERLPDAGHYVVEDGHERILPWMREFLAGNPVHTNCRS
jgi:cis-3-alkyl-4-acyloxetan-2-one decarboxylase